MRQTDGPHDGGRAILLVIGMEDQQNVQRPRQHRVDFILALVPIEHVEEVGRVAQVAVG